VRAAEGRCPHCDARLAGGSATRRPQRRSFQVGRVIVASALAGLSTASCGGRAGDESVGTAETKATTLARPDAGGGGGCVLADGGSAQCDLDSNEPACQCALPTACDWTHTCVPITCGSDEYLDSQGNCLSTYWFTGKVPSSGSCYGAPPYLG
jgi:hypothetical protein